MRIQGDPPSIRPLRGRPRLLAATSKLSSPVVSRPKASFHEVPQRARQSSSICSQSALKPAGPAHPQWMKTLEEKYRKLHLKIDSYSAQHEGAKNSYNQNVSSLSHLRSAHASYRGQSLGSLQRPVDLAELGKSVMRFAKRTGKSECRAKSTRTLPADRKHGKNKPAPIDRSIPIAQSLYTPRTEVSRQVDRAADCSHEQTEKTSNGSFDTERKTPLRDSSFDRDKHTYPCDKTRVGVDRPSENIDPLVDSYSVTDSGSDQQVYVNDYTDFPAIRSDNALEDQYRERPLCFTNDNVQTFLETTFRPTSGNPSCFSHPSTYRSPRSLRPRSSQAASESATYGRCLGATTTGMANNKRKPERKCLGVLQGMSEEAKFAITETRKEMGFHNNAFVFNSLTPIGDKRKLYTPSGVKSKSDKTDFHFTNCDNEKPQSVFRTTDKNESRHEQELYDPETETSSASVKTTADMDSSHNDPSVESNAFVEKPGQCAKLPDITQTISRSSGYVKHPYDNSFSAGKHRTVRSIKREQTFQITPPDYDVRFREVLVVEIPESETPPPDIKAQAVAKCSEWLNRRCVKNFRSTLGTFS